MARQKPHQEDDPEIVRLELVLRRNGNELPIVYELQNSRQDGDRKLTAHETLALACHLYKSRQIRARYFDEELFGEPAWDMMLTLFCAQLEGQRISVSSLCYSAHVPTTTALRWCNLLEEKQLVYRLQDEHDARRTYILLTEKGQKAIREYLAHIYSVLLPNRA